MPPLPYNPQENAFYVGGSVQDGPEDLLNMTVVVPEGAQPGMKLCCMAPDGQKLRLTVPEGVPPGSIMSLTQDPATKQWKCMAEPPDDFPPEMLMEAQTFPHEGRPQPPPTQPALPSTLPVRNPAAPQRHSTDPGGTWPTAGMAGPCMAGAMTTSIRRNPGTTGSSMLPTYAQPMPVNLSYVPAPGPLQMNMMGAPGQGMPMNPGPMPQVLAGMSRQAMTSPPATLASDPASFNPPRQQPTVGLSQGQGASYTPPPVMERHPSYTRVPQTMEQRPSYTPLERRPSYTPPPQSVVERKPSFTPVQQPLVQGATVMPAMNGQQQMNMMTHPMGVNASLTSSTVGLQMRQGSITMPSQGLSVSMASQQQMQQGATRFPSVGAQPHITQQQQAIHPYGAGVMAYNPVNQMPMQGVYSNPVYRPPG